MNSQAKRVLLVDDEETLRQSLAEQLELHGEFAVHQAGTATAAQAAVKAQPFDLILLDVGLPDMDGREVCKWMRRENVRAPIVMLTAAGSDADTVLGLDSGADDYVVKPFKLLVLLARMRAHLRQYVQSDNAEFVIGPYNFRPAAKLMVDQERNQKVRLTEKEAAILKFLYRAGGRPVAREILLNEVWGYNAGVTTHTLETHIYRLRQKIERDPADAHILITEAGGYRLLS